MAQVSYHDIHLPNEGWTHYRANTAWQYVYLHRGPMRVITHFVDDGQASISEDFDFSGLAGDFDLQVLLGEVAGSRRALYVAASLDAGTRVSPTIAGNSYSSSPPLFHTRITRASGIVPRVITSSQHVGAFTLYSTPVVYYQLEGTLTDSDVDVAIADRFLTHFDASPHDLIELRWDWEGTNPFTVPVIDPSTPLAPGDDEDVVGIPVPSVLFGPFKGPDDPEAGREYVESLARNLDLIAALAVLGSGWAVREINTAFGNLWAGDPLAEEHSALPVIGIGDVAVMLPRALAIGVDAAIPDYEAGIVPPVMSYVGGLAGRADDFLATLGDSRAVGEFLGWTWLLAALTGGLGKGLVKPRYITPLVAAANAFSKPAVKKLKDFLKSEPEDRRHKIIEDAMTEGAAIQRTLDEALEDLHGMADSDVPLYGKSLERFMRPSMDILFGKGFASQYLEGVNALRSSASMLYRGSHAAEHAAIRKHLEDANEGEGPDVL